MTESLSAEKNDVASGLPPGLLRNKVPQNSNQNPSKRKKAIEIFGNTLPVDRSADCFWLSQQYVGLEPVVVAVKGRQTDIPTIRAQLNTWLALGPRPSDSEAGSS